MNRIKRGCYWAACVGGLGLSPYAPGTVGSLAAVALYYLTYSWPLWWGVAAWCAFVLAATICVHLSLSYFSSDDPQAIVIDEVAGALLAFFMLPAGWYWLVFAFVAFRVFDIAKPWPAGWLDRNIKGAAGVMLDDLAAGVYALATVQLAHRAAVYFA